MRGAKPRLHRADRPGRDVHVERGLGKPPVELSEAAVRIWRETVSSMPDEVLRAVDVGVLSVYCASLAHWLEAEEMIRKHGLTVTLRDDKGAVRSVNVSPFINASVKFRDAVLKAGAELGLTPTARVRLRMPEKRPATKLVQMITKRGAVGAA